MVYGTGNESDAILGSAEIKPSLVNSTNISFLKNGINPDDVDRYLALN